MIREDRNLRKMRVPSVPLVTCDPYFSLWSPADRLYDTDTCHWTGRKKKLTGKIEIDGTPYRFLGTGSEACLEQTGLEIRATSSIYTMEGAGIRLELTFWTPLLLTDAELVSRPASYIDWRLEATDGKEHQIRLVWEAEEGFCHHGEKHEEMLGGTHRTQEFRAAWMGKQAQTPLGHSGDDVSIDWGYLYLAAPEGAAGDVFFEERMVSAKVNPFCSAGERCFLRAEYSYRLTERIGDYLVLAYDDVASIMYFGEVLKGYWARNGKTVMDVLKQAVQEHRILKEKSSLFDSWLAEKAKETISADYADLCALAYRQSIAAHKLAADREGNLLFLSKECDSNGCIGTVDVSYPSVPLYLLFGTEYVKGMMRPILKFAQMDVWEYDFAPHDVGRYPYANGQVYGVKEAFAPSEPTNGKVFPGYYLYPKGSHIYRHDMQMPVEESANMLIMAAAVSEQDGNADFVLPHMALLEKWAGYLLVYGEDPGEQLCTDDFAGHLAHNVNLAAKAVMGLEAFSRLLAMTGRKEEAGWYHGKAAVLAKDWEQRASAGDHTVLAYGQEESWSLKYNLVWDLVFGSGLFSEDTYRRETAWYLKMANPYGVPLDNRATYTKSDWILWTAAMAGSKEEMQQMLLPIVKYVRETETRNPFPDWYDTLTAREVHFHNRTVQGGLFMPIYCRMRGKK